MKDSEHEARGVGPGAPPDVGDGNHVGDAELGQLPRSILQILKLICVDNDLEQRRQSELYSIPSSAPQHPRIKYVEHKVWTRQELMILHNLHNQRILQKCTRL